MTAEFEEYAKAYPEPAAQFDRTIKAKLADGWEKKIPTFRLRSRWRLVMRDRL